MGLIEGGLIEAGVIRRLTIASQAPGCYPKLAHRFVVLRSKVFGVLVRRFVVLMSKVFGLQTTENLEHF